MNYTATTNRVWMEAAEHFAHFIPREKMKREESIPSMSLPLLPVGYGVEATPTTPLPVDCTGNATVNAPMDANDTYGICGPAMCDHVDRFYAWRQGKGIQLNTDVNALIKQYLKVSGGDNGVNEDMLVRQPSGIWLTGIAADPTQIVMDHLDIDVTNTALCNYAIDQFVSVQMAWSVPDDFYRNWRSGSSWLNADTPNPRNGHYTPLSDINAAGNKRLWTWGGWSWVSDSFIASVQPECFVAFSPRQFDLATGLDSKGRHVTTQGAKWVAVGGNQSIVNRIVAMFPPLDPHVCPAGQHWDTALNQCVPDIIPPICQPGFHWDVAQQKCVPDIVPPPPPAALFHLNFTQAKRKGDRVTFNAPVAIPAGTYAVSKSNAATMAEVE